MSRCGVIRCTEQQAQYKPDHWLACHPQRDTGLGDTATTRSDLAASWARSLLGSTASTTFGPRRLLHRTKPQIPVTNLLRQGHHMPIVTDSQRLLRIDFGACPPVDDL